MNSKLLVQKLFQASLRLLLYIAGIEIAGIHEIVSISRLISTTTRKFYFLATFYLSRATCVLFWEISPACPLAIKHKADFLSNVLTLLLTRLHLHYIYYALYFNTYYVIHVLPVFQRPCSSGNVHRHQIKYATSKIYFHIYT